MSIIENAIKNFSSNGEAAANNKVIITSCKYDEVTGLDLDNEYGIYLCIEHNPTYSDEQFRLFVENVMYGMMPFREIFRVSSESAAEVLEGEVITFPLFVGYEAKSTEASFILDDIVFGDMTSKAKSAS